MRRMILAIPIAVLIVAALFFAEQWSFFAPGPPAAHGRGTVVWIKAGESNAGVARQLQSAGVLRSAALFRLGVRLRGKRMALKAGEYAFSSRASMADIMGTLIEGKSIEHKITVAEGLTSAMIYALVKADPILAGSAGAEPGEGTLLPETYFFTRGVARAQILSRMAKAQKRLLSVLWPSRAPDLPLKSPRDAVILASIVEKETAIPEERRHIAAVFVNRLRLGMKLQSDPTVIYGLTQGYPLGHGIRESELTAATPYNTYVIDGLPPAPICNPGKDSIAAVLRPEPSNDLYFVANGTGGHDFTRSISEHEKNVAKWRRIEPAAKASSVLTPGAQPEIDDSVSRKTAPAANRSSHPKRRTMRHRVHRRRHGKR